MKRDFAAVNVFRCLVTAPLPRLTRFRCLATTPPPHQWLGPCRAFPMVCSWLQLIAGGVAYKEDVNRVAVDLEDDAVFPGLSPAIERFPDLLGKLVAFCGERAALGLPR